MVIEEKAIVGKLKKFPIGIQKLFAIGGKLHSCSQKNLLFRPFGSDDIEDEIDGESIDRNRSDSSTIKRSSEIRTPLLCQTYPQWKVMCDVQKLHSLQKRKRFKNRTLYILPFGTFDEHETVDSLINECNQESGLPQQCLNLFQVVSKFMSVFFQGMEVKLLPFQDINSLGFRMRVHCRTNRKQVLVTDILNYLKKVRPSDSFCIVGWSSLDLYPCSELNFVLGEASFDTGCAVISFGHYANYISKEDIGKNSGTPVHNLWKLNETSHTNVASCLLTEQCNEHPLWNCTNLGDKVVWRVLKVMIHEVCHLFGMHHCTFFACLMNESNNVSQAQNQPLFLCPVCLRKLHKFLKFTIVPRYQRLKHFLERQLSVSCNNKTDNSFCNDHTKHMNGQFVVERAEHKTNIDTFTFQKFRISLNWLDHVLIFID